MTNQWGSPAAADVCECAACGQRSRHLTSFLLRCFKSTLRKSLIHSICSYHPVPRTVSPRMLNGTQRSPILTFAPADHRHNRWPRSGPFPPHIPHVTATLQLQSHGMLLPVVSIQAVSLTSCVLPDENHVASDSVRLHCGPYQSNAKTDRNGRNEEFLCSRSTAAPSHSNDTPRDYLHAKHEPTQHDTQDVRRLLHGPSKSSVDSDWTARVVSPHVVRTIPMSKWYDDWDVVSSPDMPQPAKHCSHDACFVDGESHQAKLLSCHVVLYQCLARSHHVTSCLAMSRLRLEFVTRLRSATKVSRYPWREKTFKTELHCLVVAPCHINQALSRNTSVPDILVCCSFCDRSKRATVNNTSIVTLHIRLLLLPASERHERAPTQLMSACHNHRLQSFCERNGPSVTHFVATDIQYCEGAVCLGILEKERKHESQRANDCTPSRCSRTDPHQLLRIRMSVQRCK